MPDTIRFGRSVHRSSAPSGAKFGVSPESEVSAVTHERASFDTSWIPRDWSTSVIPFTIRYPLLLLALAALLGPSTTSSPLAAATLADRPPAAPPRAGTDRGAGARPAACCGWTGQATIQEAEPADTAKAEAAARVHAYLSRLEAFGLAGGVLVADGSEVRLARGYGVADRGRPEAGDKAGRAADGDAAGNGTESHPRPWTTGTVSTVGSITKQFTAAAIMKLVDQGRIAVDDSIGRFFDGVPPDKRGITIHHLLTHASGLGEVGHGDFEFLSRDEIVLRALESGLLSAPGDEYTYSNLGYSLLGAIVEIVTGRDYEGWLRDRLLVPAGMYETGYVLPDYELDRVAVGYRRGQRWGAIIERLNPATGPSWVLRANGGVNSTMFDMLRWVRALGLVGADVGDSDRGTGPAPLLSERSRERMFSPQIDEGAGSWYGYGWVVDTTSRGTPVIRHDGSNGILAADLHVFPEVGLVTFMMTSESGLPATQLLDRVDALWFGDDVPEPPDVAAASALRPAVLRRLAGRYVLDGGGELKVRSAGTALEIDVEGQAAVDRLWTGPRPGRVLYDSLNRRAATFVRAFAAGDFRTMRDFMGPDAPEEPYRDLRDRVLAQMGDPRDIEVLGTVPAWFHEGSSEATWVRIHFERTSAIRRIHWSVDGRVVGLGGQVYPAPVGFRCAMTGPAACTGWQPGLDLGDPRVRFVVSDVGEAASVVIRGAGGEVRGLRVP